MSVPVTVVTGIAVALSAATASLTPIVLAHRRTRTDAYAAAVANAASSGNLTLASWTALNGALQTEINRLQGVVDRMQGRIDKLEAEIAALEELIRSSPGQAKVPDLVVVFLAVSCLSLVLQIVSFARLAVQRAGSPLVKLVGDGYMRTVACRVLAATTYVVVAAVQLAGAGTLTGEALIVFSAIQSIWILNSAADIRIRRKLDGGDA